MFSALSIRILFASITVALAGTFYLGGVTAKEGCALNVNRPCYDKLRGMNLSILKTNNGQNALEACVRSSSLRERGISSVKTSFCEEESFAYCYEGKSKNFLRKFDGTCKVTAPIPMPSPTVTPIPSSTPAPLPSLEPTLTPTTSPTPTPIPTPINLDVVTIRGRFVHNFTREPLANVSIRVGTDPSGLPLFIYSGTNGEFYFSTSTIDVTQTKPKGFPFYINCYLQLGHVAAIFRNPDSSLYLASFLFDLKSGDRFINPLTTSDINLGDVPLWPAKSITVNSDIPVQLYISYPEEGRSVGNSLFKTQHSLSNVVPLEYDTITRLTDGAGNVHYSPSHKYTLRDGCSQAILNFSNGQFSWQ